MEQIDKLLKHGSKIVSDIELQQLLLEADYSCFHREVERLVDAGLLAPVKASKKNGRIPALYLKYRILKPQEDYSRYFDAIRRLHPTLNISGYLQRPEHYQKHHEIVEGISTYLWYAQDLLAKPMSRKERSFSIWGKEKLLDQHMSLVKDVLKFNGLAEDFLHYYETPEPFFEYVHEHRQSSNILVLENKDTWFTLRKLLQETGKNILAGTAFQILLYGEGNKITKPRALEGYNASMLSGGGQANRFYYFGDLDWEGIRLFYRTREANPSLELKPFSALYRCMVELAEKQSKRWELPQSPDQRGVTAALPEFLLDLGWAEEGTDGKTLMDGKHLESYLRNLLAKGKYIPQEIINYQVAADLLK